MSGNVYWWLAGIAFNPLRCWCRKRAFDKGFSFTIDAPIDKVIKVIKEVKHHTD